MYTMNFPMKRCEYVLAMYTIPNWRRSCGAAWRHQTGFNGHQTPLNDPNEKDMSLMRDIHPATMYSELNLDASRCFLPALPDSVVNDNNAMHARFTSILPVPPPRFNSLAC